MKPSERHLGLEIQLFLMRQGLQIDALAQELGITPEALSNLIHGRRRFKDPTLKRLAETKIFKKGGFTLRKLKAFRAMDEYKLDEIILALLELIKKGEIENLPKDFFALFQAEMEQSGFPPALAERKRALLQLMKPD